MTRQNLKAESSKLKARSMTKICPECGREFETDRISQVCCSVPCSNRRHGRHRKESRERCREAAAKRAAKEQAERQRRLERCRETAPVTVVERGNRVIETRGVVPISSWAGRPINC